MPRKPTKDLQKDQVQSSGSHEQNYSLSIISMHVYNTPFESQMRTGPPWGPIIDGF
jgi:hypothetical protein